MTDINCPCGKKILMADNEEWSVKCGKCGLIYTRRFNVKLDDYEIIVKETE